MHKLLCLIILATFSFTFIGSSFATEPVEIIKDLSPKSLSLSAEQRLKMLAVKRENYRKVGDTIGIATGVLSILLGVVYAAQPPSEPDPLIEHPVNDTGATALAMVGLGLICIAVSLVDTNNLSPLELSYKEVASAPSSTEAEKAQREALAANLLKRNADQSHMGRIAGGFLFSGIGAALAANINNNSADRTLGYCYVGLGIFDFLFRTDVEYEYDDYLESSTITAEAK